MAALPPPVWNNIFNYYVTEADTATKGIDLHVVRSRLGIRYDNSADITRKVAGDTCHRITRVARQGAFDNVHMAPTMRLPQIAGIRAPADALFPDYYPMDADARAKWNLDKIVMAPFCVHDCFHLHWRWTDNSDEPGTFGFSGGKPNRLAGAPMVPENQDVDIAFPASNVLVYKARAHWCPADSWQVFCHHGAGYLVKAGLKMQAARAGLSAPSLTIRSMSDSSNVAFLKEQPMPLGEFSPGQLDLLNELTPVRSWAAFYWHIRYFYDSGSGPSERVVINDLQKVIDF
jgi:hypothetical protein